MIDPLGQPASGVVAAESDAELLARFTKASDQAAFAELVRRHQRLVHGACMRVLGNAADADDASQRCFMQLAFKGGTISGAVGAWLRTCAVRQAIDQRRERAARRERQHEFAKAAVGDAGPEPEARPRWEELAPRLQDLLEHLPPDQRVALVEHFLGGRTQRQIAASFGVSVATMSRRVDAALASLRDLLRRDGLALSVPALMAALARAGVELPPAAGAASAAAAPVPPAPPAVAADRRRRSHGGGRSSCSSRWR